ncbi:MAG: LamG-like jellyroll fold domain-containing protein [Dyadobacter sp.]|uniref:LamG-like jellyroll fold domain-containing protein n=1 Tax=Dyadobacter sp. TaxID=1914288 RepID=UPI00326331F3
MKYYFYLIFSFFFPFLSGTTAQVNLNQGLIGCYPFTGNANDLSNRNNDGDVRGAKLTTDRFGNANAAYDFDGIDDFIEIGVQDLKINEFSYSMWIYPRSLPSYDQAFFMFSIGSASGDQGMLIGNEYTGVLTGFSNGSYLGYDYNVRCMTRAMPKLNQWYHIVLAKDVTNYYFYVDGKLICASPTKGSAAYYGTGIVKATIGARFNYGQAINAIIDDVHLYNRSLNTTEVETLFKGVPSTAPEKITLTQDKTTTCAGEQIQFTASVNSPTVSYYWKVDGIIQSIAFSNEFIYQLPDRHVDYQTTISVEASDKNSCFPSDPATAEKTITVAKCDSSSENPSLFVPTAFTPNNDGKNDTWEIFNPDAFSELKISIFNRWGEVIFQSAGYARPWNGTYKGVVVPAGAYPYKIYSQRNLIKQGVVSIIH